MEWYYVGHYGQLGPLTEDQMDGLITDQVIERTTYIWGTGMAEWVNASMVPQFANKFNAPPSSPPPFIPSAPPAQNVAIPPVSDPFRQAFNTQPSHVPDPYHRMDQFQYPISDKSRIAGGILQFVIPGVGRIYLGHVATGVLQLLMIPCLVGVIWAYIDGILMLTGGVQFDGYGRRLT